MGAYRLAVSPGWVITHYEAAGDDAAIARGRAEAERAPELPWPNRVLSYRVERLDADRWTEISAWVPAALFGNGAPQEDIAAS